MKAQALGIIDAQRGFMPAEEGIRLGVPGFGELPVDSGEQIVSPADRLLTEYIIRGCLTFTTQDWHPARTAHFSDTPDFSTTWPVHCVGGAPGAEIHPDIFLPVSVQRFKKGMEVLIRGEDDRSYSGYDSVNENGEPLNAVLRELGIRRVALGGLALDYCVGKTALDLRTKLDLEVVVAIDATRGITDESSALMLEQFKSSGIEVAESSTILAQLESA